MTLRYLSVCSGIEAFAVACEALPFEPVMFSEIEPFPCAVLTHQQRATDLRGGVRPGRVALWGDMAALRVRHFRRFGIPLPDVLVGGTPCQSFSVAGLRRGMLDPRGGLTLSFVRLAHALAATGALRNALWENVPGILSHADNAFGCFLGALVGADDALRSPGKQGRWPRIGMVAGPRARAAWRVFDAQYFDLAQQRARLFVVVDFGNGADPAEVLFERKSLRRDTAPRRKAGETVAALTASGVGTCGADDNQAQAGHLIAAWAIQERAVSENPAAGPDGAGFREGLAYTLEARSVPQSVAFGGNNCSGPIEVSPALTAHAGPCGRMDFESEAFIADVAPTLRTASGDFNHIGDWKGLIAFDCKSSDPARGVTGDKFTTLRAMASTTSHQNGGGHLAVAGESGVRRLTPRECERLQGFPDDYTLIPWRKGLAPDGLRYRALGNSMAVPVMRWIGARINAVMRGRAA